MTQSPLRSEAPKLLLVSFLLFYFVAGIYTARLPGGEWYPFFSWFLFPTTPLPQQTDHSIRFLAVAGKELDPPLLLHENHGLLSLEAHSSTEYLGIVRMLGESMERRDQKGVEHYREQLEKNFLYRPVRYELVKITFNPIERFRNGTILKVTSVKTFESISR
ncbi:MAG: hypothetical protein Q8P12_06515 [bacterium]|nr:hypothetical protein [bacterium]MDZ4231718.1 hypothetical protein [Candidatus Pacearchaeota archaeon]